MLALAEIKETWDAVPTGDSWSGGWYDDEFEDPDDDPDGEDGYDLNSLIDDEMASAGGSRRTAPVARQSASPWALTRSVR